MPSWVLFFLIVIGIPAAAKIFQRWARLKERQMELAALTAGEHAAQYAAKMERLEARVAVLERIATDRRTALSDEIDSLRLPPLN